ncbi:MAG TPA: MgtC/SapB family protein [Phototrophicaceae bacterium]|nr:MgtC/SapB family protein [Phototrophicaceae bacterium]
MSLYQQAEAVIYLILAVFLGWIVGLDREHRDQPAGLRTHMLVCLGACLFTVLSKYGFVGNDTARVAANVVVGIGFLGAGVIIERRGSPRHLTTAANIWATAAVGMAVGVGAWLLATAAALLMWMILAVIRQFSKNNPTSRVAKEEAQDN